MKKAEFVRLMDNDPQKLIDDEVEFAFMEVEGRVKFIDAWAAGTAFYFFKFVSGKYEGKVLACEEARSGVWTYNVRQNSDGFLFNWDPADDVSDVGDGEVTGGDCIPELDDCVLTYKEV